MPMMMSYRTIAGLQKNLPRAAGIWTQDSSGFTELNLHGQYMTSAQAYAARTRLHMHDIGSLHWAAIQDWMCEDSVLAKTGLTIEEHQRRTVQSYIDLQELAPDVPWLPVIQGQVLGDYLRHVELYARAGRCSRLRTHKQCSNCLDYALLWRQRLLDRLEQPRMFA